MSVGLASSVRGAAPPLGRAGRNGGVGVRLLAQSYYVSRVGGSLPTMIALDAAEALAWVDAAPGEGRWRVTQSDGRVVSTFELMALAARPPIATDLEAKRAAYPIARSKTECRRFMRGFAACPQPRPAAPPDAELMRRAAAAAERALRHTEMSQRSVAASRALLDDALRLLARTAF